MPEDGMPPKIEPGAIYPVILPVPESEARLTGRAKVLALSRRAREALSLSADKSGLTLTVMDKDSDGVPLPDHGVYWSLTHKSAFVGAVASDRPIGIDIERIRPVSRDLLQRIADPQEWLLADGQDPNRLFFHYWTAKEAVLKTVGKGMAGLSKCRIVKIVEPLSMVLVYEDRPFLVEHCLFAGHVAAVVKKVERVCWTRLF
jgi:4'-phosphopantetheinyl transferase